MPKLKINGFSMQYDDSGTGKVLIFQHGWISSRTAWGFVISGLAHRYRCITLDSRGAGGSERTTVGHTIEQYAKDMVALATALRIGRFTAIGYDMGGVIATQAALNAPERVERLILVSSTPGVEFAPDELVQRLIGIADQIAAGDQGAAEAILRSIWERQQEGIVQLATRTAMECSPEFVTESIRSFAETRLADRLDEILVPTIGITGALDPLLAGTLAVNEHIENGTIHVFSRVNHMPVVEVPAELAGVIDDFIKHSSPAV